MQILQCSCIIASLTPAQLLCVQLLACIQTEAYKRWVDSGSLHQWGEIVAFTILWVDGNCWIMWTYKYIYVYIFWLTITESAPCICGFHWKQWNILSVCRATSVWFPHVLFVKSVDIPLEKPGNFNRQHRIILKNGVEFVFFFNGAPAFLLALQKYSLNISICKARTTAFFKKPH